MPTTYIPLTTIGEGAEVGAGAEGVIMVAEGNNFLVKRKNKQKPSQTRSAPQQQRKEGDTKLLTPLSAVLLAKVAPSQPNKDICMPSKA